MNLEAVADKATDLRTSLTVRKAGDLNPPVRCAKRTGLEGKP